MNATNWLKWMSIGLLVSSLAAAMTACDDDDGDDPGTTTVVVTNTVGGTIRTNTVVVTNAPAADEGDGGTEDPPPALRLIAPTLISPADGASFTTMTPAIAYNVTMKWSAVSGAATYVIEVDGTPYATDGTSRTMGFAIGTHTWRVWARTASNVDGWPSSTISFAVRERLFGM